MGWPSECRKLLQELHTFWNYKEDLSMTDRLITKGAIHEAVEKCGICQASSKSAKPVGNVSEVPPHAWHNLETDLFYWNKIYYLVAGDNLVNS